MVTINQIRIARTRKALRLLARRAQAEKDSIVNNPHIRSNVKVKVRKDYAKKMHLIKNMWKRVN